MHRYILIVIYILDICICREFVVQPRQQVVFRAVDDRRSVLVDDDDEGDDAVVELFERLA